jgi:GNAT superfamily N-acetyltransferase
MSRLRRATFDDAVAIARLHAESWRVAYRGALRDGFLDGDDVLQDRLDVWKTRLAASPANQFVVVAEEGDRMVGFACAFGRDDERWGTLLDNIHVRRERHGQGMGTRLLAEVAGWSLATYPDVGLYLRVLESNHQAQRFYRHLGATDRAGDAWVPPGGGAVARRWYAWSRAELAELQRCQEYARFKRADLAFRTGDVAALRVALDDPPEFPNVRGPRGIECSCLQNAIYHSPVPFIRVLLELGADPNYDDHDGFPSLMAALSSASTDGAARRDDVHEILRLLLEFGADPSQRGHNDYTPLHFVAATGDVVAAELLLRHGADREARTRIDDYETAADAAERAGHRDLVVRLRRS